MKKYLITSRGKLQTCFTPQKGIVSRMLPKEYSGGYLYLKMSCFGGEGRATRSSLGGVEKGVGRKLVG